MCDKGVAIVKYILYLIIAMMPFYALSFDNSFFPFNFEGGEGPEYSYFNEGVEKAQSGDYESALQLFHKAIKINPYIDTFFISRGYTYIGLSLTINDKDQTNISSEDTLKNKYLNKAVEDFRTVIKLVFSSEAAYQGLGFSLYLIGDYAASVKFSKKAINLNPESAKDYYILGMSLSVLGSYKESLVAISKAIELSPDNPHFYYDRVLIRARHSLEEKNLKPSETENADKEIKFMIEDLEKVIELQPDNKEANYVLNELQQREKNYPTRLKVIRMFNKLFRKLKYRLDLYIKSVDRSRNTLSKKCKSVFK